MFHRRFLPIAFGLILSAGATLSAVEPSGAVGTVGAPFVCALSPNGVDGTKTKTEARHVSFCTRNEEIVFACRTGSKVVSVCASADASARKGYLQYRFGIRFFMLQSTYMDPDQVKWIENELKTSTEAWKIAVLHHPPYSSSATHGSSLSLRATLEPMFVKYGVSVVLSGHDHVYERVKPQQGITYFVIGSGGELRRGDIKKTALTDLGFDTDNAFLVSEIIDHTMYFNAISRTGKVVDSGIITMRTAPK